MNNLQNKVIGVLKELQTASLSIQQSNNENEILSKIHTYDMLFLGEKYNEIHSVELCHSLNTVFGINITNEQLNELLPTVCPMLNMSCEKYISVSDIGKIDAPTRSYNIKLY